MPMIELSKGEIEAVEYAYNSILTDYHSYKRKRKEPDDKALAEEMYYQKLIALQSVLKKASGGKLHFAGDIPKPGEL